MTLSTKYQEFVRQQVKQPGSWVTIALAIPLARLQLSR